MRLVHPVTPSKSSTPPIIMPAAATPPGRRPPVRITAEIAFHRLHRQRQTVKQACRDQETGEAEQHAGRCQTGDGHRSYDVRNESAEIAASTAAFHQEAACWRGHAKFSHEPQYQKAAALARSHQRLRSLREP
jgi:hypothetical protein